MAVSQRIEKMGRREQNKLEKRARIVAAARALFRAKGYGQTTTQEIADAAEIATGTLFLYAPTKEDLLVMVFKDEMIETAETARKRRNSDTSITDQVTAFFSKMIDYHQDNLDIARLLLKEAAAPASDERANDIADVLAAILGGLSELFPKTRSNEDLIREWSEILFSVYYFELLRWLSTGLNRAQFEKRLRDKVQLMLATIAAA